MAETTGFDFTNLTPAQKALLTLQGWAPGGGKQPRPNTVTKLVARGLVVVRTVRVAGVDIAAYDVPTAVHAAWCEHCAGIEHNGYPK